MSGSMLYVVLPLAALYAVFLVWYGGSGRPLTREEIDSYLAALRRNAGDGSAGLIHLDDVERMLEHDDGREFIMHNVIRYRQ